MAVIDSGLYSDLGRNFGPARYITPLLDAMQRILAELETAKQQKSAHPAEQLAAKP